MRQAPGAQYALRIVNFGAPAVRQRFPRGVLVDPAGFPQWSLCARAMVRLPDPSPSLTLEETRVVDVLAANALLATGDDPLWRAPVGGSAVKTPQGWTWAHIGGTRDLALVPVELHASYRHAGGVRTLAAHPAFAERDHGLRVDHEPRPAQAYQFQTVSEQILTELERHLGFGLPPSYRTFFAATNGAAPLHAAVLSGHGFIADQRFFGLGRADEAQDLVLANQYVADRFTDEFLAVGYVQGGTIAVKVRGADTDSVWYLDDDDPRDEVGYDAGHIAAHLLHRCADTIRQFWDRLAEPAQDLQTTAAGWVRSGAIREIRPEGIGDNLPAEYRAAWQPEPVADEVYFANPVVQLALLAPDGST